MTTSENSVSSGFDRLNGLMQWWGLSDAVGSDEIEARTARLQVLITDLNKIANDASSCQTDAFLTTSDRFAGALQELLRAREPQQILTAQSLLTAGVLEGLVAQTRMWAELTQKMHDCCSAVAGEMVRATEEDTAPKARSGQRPAPAGQTEQPAAKRAT